MAFTNCPSITEIDLPSSLTKIKSNSFQGCTSLKKNTIPSSMSVIEESCFEGCIALEDIEIPFKNCKAIKISKLPPHLETWA